MTQSLTTGMRSADLAGDAKRRVPLPQRRNRMIRDKKGLLFDLDGVLTDTARYHYLAWKRLARELGMDFSEEDNEKLKGVGRIESLDMILALNRKERAVPDFSDAEKQRLADRKNTYYQEFITRITPRDILPGIPEFLKDARKEGFLMAVASASRNAKTVLARLELSDWFDYVADARNIKKVKPDPEVFLACAEALGLKPSECIGLEDSQAGIEAIHRAGMFSVGIHVHVVSRKPDISFESTKELNLQQIYQSSTY